MTEFEIVQKDAVTFRAPSATPWREYVAQAAAMPADAALRLPESAAGERSAVQRACKLYGAGTVGSRKSTVDGRVYLVRRKAAAS